MLGDAELIAFVPTREPKKARRFYERTLGLEFVSEDAFAVVMRAKGVMIRIVNVSNVGEFRPWPFTILGWRVGNIEKAVAELGEKGIEFERFAGLEQDGMGIWKSPSGARVAWFKDLDGNVLSVTEFGA
jgi:catechol 2,3-dioxygenase-like lactoylglutathione lyase family enzyme